MHRISIEIVVIHHGFIFQSVCLSLSLSDAMSTNERRKETEETVMACFDFNPVMNEIARLL